MKSNYYVSKIILFVLFITVSCGQIKKYYNEADVNKIAHNRFGGNADNIEQLHGGLSEARLFKFKAADKYYVIKFITVDKVFKNEFESVKIASDNGWGPKLYDFDSHERYFIIEYIKPETISDRTRQDQKLYIALADVLKKVHQSPKIDNKINIFDQINEKLQVLRGRKNNPNNIVIYDEIQSFVDNVKNKVKLDYKTCHNDIHPGNLIYNGGSFYAIDSHLAMNDPYFDIATMVIFWPSSEYETLFLETYFDRKLTSQEVEKLGIMKKITGILYALKLLYTVKSNILINLDINTTTSISEFVRDNDLKKYDSRIKFASILLKQALFSERKD